MGLFSSKKGARIAGDTARRKSGPIVSAVVPAAGSGTRMGGVDKLRAPVLGKPLLIHTLLAFQRHEAITEIIIAAREEDLLGLAELCRSEGITKLSKIVKGGASRAESVLLALTECHPKAKLAVIHDGARPCVSDGIITSAVQTALQTGAAAPGVPPVDTLKALSEDGQIIASTIDRGRVVQIQTPQCFYTALIKAALTEALQSGHPPTDDCAAVEALGVPVWVTKGEPENFKVTTPGDLERAEMVLRNKGVHL